MGKYIVGIDEGTTGCKTCVFDLEGNLVGSDYREYPTHFPRPGWVEQYPEEITPALFASCKAAIERSGVDNREIIALGLSSQGGVIGMLDAHGDLLRPFVGWQDLRGKEMTDSILARISREDFYKIAGDPLGYVFSATKLAWLREHEPENWNRTAVFSTHQDYFLRQFGAEGYWTDLSSASREGTMDVDNHRWSDELHELLGIRPEQRAAVVAEPGLVVGRITPEVAELTGLMAGTPLCMGAHDQNCCTLGAGGVDAGTAVMVVGTFGSCFVVCDTPIRDPNGKLVVKGNHGVGNWTIEAFANASASCFRWYRDVFANLEVAAGAEIGEDPYSLITRSFAAVPPGANGVTFLPFLQGAAGARNNADARGAFIGMSLATTKAEMSRAVVEGITNELRDILEAQARAGITVEEIRLSGGAAKSPAWCQILADSFQRPIELLQTSETGCLGAALYAAVGAGAFADVSEAVNRAVKVTARFEPDRGAAGAYDDAFARYLATADALSPLG